MPPTSNTTRFSRQMQPRPLTPLSRATGTWAGPQRASLPGARPLPQEAANQPPAQGPGGPVRQTVAQPRGQWQGQEQPRSTYDIARPGYEGGASTWYTTSREGFKGPATNPNAGGTLLQTTGPMGGPFVGRPGGPVGQQGQANLPPPMNPGMARRPGPMLSAPGPRGPTGPTGQGYSAGAPGTPQPSPGLSFRDLAPAARMQAAQDFARRYAASLQGQDQGMTEAGPKEMPGAAPQQVQEQQPLESQRQAVVDTSPEQQQRDREALQRLIDSGASYQQISEAASELGFDIRDRNRDGVIDNSEFEQALKDHAGTGVPQDSQLYPSNWTQQKQLEKTLRENGFKIGPNGEVLTEQGPVGNIYDPSSLTGKAKYLAEQAGLLDNQTDPYAELLNSLDGYQEESRAAMEKVIQAQRQRSAQESARAMIVGQEMAARGGVSPEVAAGMRAEMQQQAGVAQASAEAQLRVQQLQQAVAINRDRLAILQDRLRQSQNAAERQAILQSQQQLMRYQAELQAEIAAASGGGAAGFLSGGLGGAAGGAAIGSLAGPVGAGIGAGAGFLLGGLASVV